jgi:hypothetical protein
MAGKVVSKHRTSAERPPAVGERRDGKVTVMVPVSEAEVDLLVAKKYLAERTARIRLPLSTPLNRIYLPARRLPHCDEGTGSLRPGQRPIGNRE